MKGFKSLLFIALVAVTGVFGTVACDSLTNDAVQPSAFSRSTVVDNGGFTGGAVSAGDEFAADEAMSVAAIDTALQVKVKINVTSACSATGNAGFKYIEGNVSTPTVSGTAANAAAGFKGFSVPVAKFNTPILKTFDKTKSYTIYAKVPGVASRPASGTMGQPGYVARVPAVPVSYKRVLVLPANPVAEKAMNAAGTKRIGRPITTATTTLGCPS